MVTTASSTPGDAATTHAWGAGISIDRGGRMTLDEAKLEKYRLEEKAAA